MCLYHISLTAVTNRYQLGSKLPARPPHRKTGFTIFTIIFVTGEYEYKPIFAFPAIQYVMNYKMCYSVNCTNSMSSEKRYTYMR
jgi:hypothetical protein